MGTWRREASRQVSCHECLAWAALYSHGLLTNVQRVYGVFFAWPQADAFLSARVLGCCLDSISWRGGGCCMDGCGAPMKLVTRAVALGVRHALTALLQALTWILGLWAGNTLQLESMGPP
ncbi:hypothetical protein TcCL_NonESM10291 [Trypanosoma cruzi]|nr:hypothetical protein TcCL_NonESM10291 [Trypanosoma cruzi]